MRWTLNLLLDAVLIIIFAAIGRRTHEHGLDVLGVLGTAAPFLLALLALASMTRYPVTSDRLWPQGVMTWLGVVAFGLALRVIFGDTAALAFVIVTTVTLGILLLGRRLVTGFLARRKSPDASPKL
ncbi:DUF3054 domain-containing protein [Zhihengliuella flava]|uniref:DUF3054 domain-containing protein n=1 Tax=Zhihengliuella flava TaxID=1285193 RepID=A0A931D440_9MICC|nr:DUF3054 domain-containing protein [Zhihengliuella flava]MBG6083380.1 hypothetical protein [Zhihengliuella flava]